LAGAVLHREQGTEQIGVEVLHFVDEQSERGALLAHDVADCFDQLLEVEVDVSAGGPPAEGEFDLGRAQADAEGEPRAREARSSMTFCR
jgi:hypothetical protein